MADFDERTEKFEKALRLGESFDIAKRELLALGGVVYVYYADGCVKDDAVERLLISLCSHGELRDGATPEDVIKAAFPYLDVKRKTDVGELVRSVMCGECVFLSSVCSYGLSVNARAFPSREIDEPENEKVIRGARDGYVETLLKNTAVIRRRIRDPSLTFRRLTVGRSTKTDVAVAYMSGRADPALVERVTEKLTHADVDGVIMGHQSLAEILIKEKWFDPFPKIRYTERPDASCAMLLEGSVILLCDSSPEAMILPTSIFDFMQETGDYYHTPLTGTYLRILRLVIYFLTVFLIPAWYLLIKEPSLIPPALNFLKISNAGGLPVIVQLYVIEFAIDGLKLASLNTPSALNNSLSAIGGLILGDFAVQAGWFAPEVILYSAFVSIANFTQPSNELGHAFKFLRLMITTLTFLFGRWGFISGALFSLLLLLLNKTVDGRRGYLYPLIPFDRKALKALIVRERLK